MLPIALEEALYYLEDQVSEEGISLEGMTLPEKSESVDMVHAFNQVDQLAAGHAGALAGILFTKSQPEIPEQTHEVAITPEQRDFSSGSDVLSEMPDDPDEVLAWLEGLAKDPQALAEATAVAVEDTHPPEILPVVEETTPIVNREEQVVPEEDGILAEMPEDPDEAMAWLDKVAAQQTSEGTAPMAEEASAHFAAVSHALADGNIDQAAAIYHEILQQDSMLPQAVISLETAVAENPTSGQLRHLLGDAYMRQGQMQKALEVYRQGFLDHL
jgi:tetratricopeptide (TPR) repeat protein